MTPECYSFRYLCLFGPQLFVRLFCSYTQYRYPQVLLFQLDPNTELFDPSHRVLLLATSKAL